MSKMFYQKIAATFSRFVEFNNDGHCQVYIICKKFYSTVNQFKVNLTVIAMFNNVWASEIKFCF